MLGRRLRIVALAAIVLFVVASFVDVDEPWFAIWVALLGAAAVLPGVSVRDGGKGRPAYFLALFAAVWVFAVNSYYVEIQRQRSERFDVVGVHLTPPRSGVVRIGAADLSADGSAPDSLDVRLEPSTDPVQRWAVTLRRDTKRRGFIVDSMEGVESLQQKREWNRSPSRRLWERVVRFDPAWVQLWGDELSLSSPEVNAIAARRNGLTHHFRLIESSEGRFLEWNGVRAPLVLPDTSPMLEVLGRRLTRK
ncbi:MAG: hypothetical protein JF602_06595, partial [Gemmatimonadetes bacterium]|nr:hypothetical protein [Gemmatimonadota bacterium]